MIFEKYDWCDDRIAFFEIDQMRHNLWNSISMGKLIIQITYPNLNIDNVYFRIQSSCVRQLINKRYDK